MIIIKNKRAINNMREAGRRLAEVMEEISSFVKPGISTLELDDIIIEKMASKGLRAECKGYCGYKYASCISINDVVIHGLPSKDNILKNGDLVKIDVVGSYNSYCADMTRCFFVGNVATIVKRLVAAAQNALDEGITEIFPGKHLSDVSVKIQREVEVEGFGVVRSFAGHGIGRTMHEEPEIPNFGKSGEGPILMPGMTLAIEPMITEGNYKVVVDKDGWTVRTADGSLACHVEDTVLVTDDGFEILTRIK